MIDFCISMEGKNKIEKHEKNLRKLVDNLHIGQYYI